MHCSLSFALYTSRLEGCCGPPYIVCKTNSEPLLCCSAVILGRVALEARVSVLALALVEGRTGFAICDLAIFYHASGRPRCHRLRLQYVPGTVTETEHVPSRHRGTRRQYHTGWISATSEPCPNGGSVRLFSKCINLRFLTKHR